MLNQRLFRSLFGVLARMVQRLVALTTMLAENLHDILVILLVVSLDVVSTLTF